MPQVDKDEGNPTTNNGPANGKFSLTIATNPKTHTLLDTSSAQPSPYNAMPL